MENVWRKAKEKVRLRALCVPSEIFRDMSSSVSVLGHGISYHHLTVRSSAGGDQLPREMASVALAPRREGEILD
jgi:hypothetical protein